MARNVLLVDSLRKVVPTAAGELVILDGIDLEINESRIWLAPKGVEDAKLLVIRAALRAAIEIPNVRRRLEGLGITPIYGDQDYVLADIDRMRELSEPIIPKIRRR